MSRRVIIIGAGIGGLSAAIRLAAAGYGVTILEQQNEVGGKLQRVEGNGYTFDRGPSTITMIHHFEAIFRQVGKHINNYVNFYPIAEGTRHYFPDGTIVDFSTDAGAMEAQMAVYSEHDAKMYRSFMQESERLYRLSERHFLNRLLASWQDKASPSLAFAFAKARPFETYAGLLNRYFRHPYTKALFGRYATYVGSDPERAPAIFAMLAHAEQRHGVYGVRGGTYALVLGLKRLALELSVDIRTSVRVERIASTNGRVTGAETAIGFLPADIVIANGDVLSVNRDLIVAKDRPAMTDARIRRYEPSLSGFAMLLGVKQTYPLLRHHTVFFPERYGEEFDAIFREQRPPREPALYICNTSYSEAGLAPEGASNLFVLANAPYLTEEWSWQDRQEAVADRIISRLEACGMQNLREHLEFRSLYTPADLAKDTSAYRGAIYGISSNRPSQTFARPSNRGSLRGLWFVGGTTHPGGGTPMVAASGQLVAEAVIREDR
ncbi:phytoene desaturase family protein [Paenibacillus methanolicus]|uniref:4,4'-diaponeurosporene oxygenase n=1 Tax=Paenibacillus methanolicus TaxID=582686 RepID=A0A5S5CLC0_9BACL|nr:phytoene desaturase [Paenibacillus methanolicus]